MPRYFFDTYDGTVIFDDEGRLLPDLTSARLAARHLLEELVRHASPDRAESRFRADIRDEAGRVICTATLVLAYEGV